MADIETPPAEGEIQQKKKGLPAAVIPAVAIVLGVGGGAFVGATIVAPKLMHGVGTGAISAAELSVDSTKQAADDHADGGDEKKKKGDQSPAAPPIVYTVADMVLNPAGSGGQRFVMLSVAMEANDSAAVATLEARDPEIRDAILALVGGKTVEELAEVTAREPLKGQIIATVTKITKAKLVKRVSFPQFVIQ